MNEIFDKILLNTAVFFDWPTWVAKTVIILTCGISVISFLQLNSLISAFMTVFTVSPNAEPCMKQNTSISFRWFQVQYLTVYLLIMLADWLQGTNMYTLYSVSLGAILIF